MKRSILLGGAIASASGFFAIAVVACSSSSNNSTFDGGGTGLTGVNGDSGAFSFNDVSTTSDDGGNANGADGGCNANLTARLRDFVNKPGFTPSSALDDDFENDNGDDRDIVLTDLGSDLKPVYAHPDGGTNTTHGKTQFDWWYRDTDGKNQAFDYTIVLTPTGSGNVKSFNDQEFFPLDGRGWNDEYIADDGKLHNFSFTLELHTTFSYSGGEVFTFIGDDDVFVFINRKLVVNLGGVHGAETKSVMLDSLTTDDATNTAVPLTTGTTYPLDVFYNERHTTASHFRMDTSIVFNNCDAIIVK